MPSMTRPTRTGYEFGGYWTGKGGSGTQYYTQAGASARTWNIANNTTLYAKWTANTYTVQFDANSGSVTPSSKNVTYDATYGDLPTPTRTGYAFGGWYTSTSGGSQVTAETKVSITASQTLYARWTANDYTVTFDANGGTGSMSDQSFTYDVAKNLTSNSFEKTGYSFGGWAIAPASASEYGDGQLVTNLTATASGKVTLYASWAPIAYTISFDGNGADNPNSMTGDVMVFEGTEAKMLVANKFEKMGYTFAGWATNETDAAALDVIYTNCAEVVSTNLWMAIGETNVFFAVWQTNTYTVVFNANGGTGAMDGQEFVYDQARALAECEFTSNLKFQGWATSQSGGKVFDDKATVSNLTFEAGGVVTLYAVWDNGELSKAMHCNNLFWTQDTPGDAPWAERIGDEEGYNPSDSLPSGSSVCAIVPGDEEQSYVMMPSGASGGGRLSFWYKMSNADQCWLNFSADGTSELTIAPKTEWTRYGPVDIEEIADVYLTFSLSESSSSLVEYKVYIDQMTWVPDGQEPTDEDKPTISGFTKTTDGFALSVDQTNISDSFSYQILATNELVNGDWPVKKTLTADELKAGYEIVIEENEPKMFYKVKVISK